MSMENRGPKRCYRFCRGRKSVTRFFGGIMEINIEIFDEEIFAEARIDHP
jgi:hypothetical protein